MLFLSNWFNALKSVQKTLGMEGAEKQDLHAQVDK